MFAYNLSTQPLPTQSVGAVDQATEKPMVQLKPVSQDSEKQAGFDWPVSFLLGCGLCVLALLATAVCCCRFPACRG